MVAVAQLVEHLVVVQAVAGSSPVSHPIYFELLNTFKVNEVKKIKRIYQKIRPKAWFFVFVCFSP
jgi:hypothetical protein